MRHNFKHLKVLHTSMDLTDLAIEYIKDLPGIERYNLIDQITGVLVPFPLNIAEGWGKRINVHFGEFYQRH
jgi:four helix bundle protein